MKTQIPVPTILHFSVYRACFTFKNVEYITLCTVNQVEVEGKVSFYLNTLHDVNNHKWHPLYSYIFHGKFGPLDVTPRPVY